MEVPRCPCGGLFTPDQVRAADPSAECTFCKRRVLLRPPPSPPEAPRPKALEWPSGFVVTESPAPALPPGSVDPYRAAPVAPPRGALTITWKAAAPRWVWLFYIVWCGGLILFAAASGERHAPLVLVLVAATTWHQLGSFVNTQRIVVDGAELRFTSRPVPYIRGIRLAASEVSQLFTLETPRKKDGPLYFVYVRDRRGRDRQLVQLEAPEQCWWLEEKLEQHLGLVDRPIDGELRRPMEERPGGDR